MVDSDGNVFSSILQSELKITILLKDSVCVCIYIYTQIIKESGWMDLSEMLQRLLEEEGD